jgi:uncharacterized protein (DUF488 family)
MTSRLYTVGHSTHPLEEFVRIVRAHRVGCIVDVRTIPKSRHNPQFGEEELRSSLPANGIDYRRLESLGGLRHTRKDSPNGAWKNASFRGYADYMQTPEFAAGIDQLLVLCERATVAIMCAEAVPWRCHRSMIGDALVVRGVAVEDILSATSVRAHTLTPFAVVAGSRITYPPTESQH